MSFSLPLSQTLLGLSIDESNGVPVCNARNHEAVTTGNLDIMLLFNIDHVVLFINTYVTMKTMNILENFCMHNKLSIHSSKLKVMLMKTYKRISYIVCPIISPT